jgi:hypothetical protein
MLGLMLLFSGDPLVPSFATLIKNFKVEPVVESVVIDVPYLTWGGDVATFYANGGVETTQDSVFGKSGLKYRLVNGDDFLQQTRNYLSGKTPYLRGTFTQLGQASELLNQDPSTKPIIILQLTWSLGDHIVGRGNIKSINNFKGKTICLQQGGPHVGLVDDALKSGGLKWTDVKIVWAKNLSGPDSPAEMMKKDNSIDLACVISPDMTGLTGGLNSHGTGAEGTIKDARVVVSTASMSRSIADLYCVRQDYFRAHRDEVEKFVAGYLAATDSLMNHKKVYNDGKGKSPEYLEVLKMAQKIYGEKVLPTIEVDAHGLVSDANFVGLTGNMSFFTDTGNLSGFDAKQKQTLDLVTNLGYCGQRMGFVVAGWDFQQLAKLAGVKYEVPKVAVGRIQGESIGGFEEKELDDKTLVSFTVQFEPNQTDFSIDSYGAEFKRVVENASRFGNAVFLVRGHSDPSQTLIDFVKAGQTKGILQRTGTKGSYKYFLNGEEMTLESTAKVMQAVLNGDFNGVQPNPQATMTAALQLSQVRADKVKTAIIEFAKQNKMNLDPSQIQPRGIGIREPLIARPVNSAQARNNMRVEFRLIRVEAESIKGGEYDY